MALGDLGAEFVGARAQGLVRERGDFRLQRIDLRHPRLVALQTAIVGGAEDLLARLPNIPTTFQAAVCSDEEGRRPNVGRLSAEHKSAAPGPRKCGEILRDVPERREFANIFPREE